MFSFLLLDGPSTGELENSKTEFPKQNIERKISYCSNKSELEKHKKRTNENKSVIEQPKDSKNNIQCSSKTTSKPELQFKSLDEKINEFISEEVTNPDKIFIKPSVTGDKLRVLFTNSKDIFQCNQFAISLPEEGSTLQNFLEKVI